MSKFILGDYVQFGFYRGNRGRVIEIDERGSEPTYGVTWEGQPGQVSWGNPESELIAAPIPPSPSQKDREDWVIRVLELDRQIRIAKEGIARMREEQQRLREYLQA